MDPSCGPQALPCCPVRDCPYVWAGSSKGKGTLQTIPTVCIPSKNCVIGGTQDGSIYIFRMSEGVPMHVKTIEKAHAGPVFDLWANETSIFSAGKDSRIQCWRFSLKLGSVDLQYLKTNDLSEIIGGAQPQAAKSVSVRVSPPALVVGLSNNEVYEIDEVNNKHRLLVRGHAGGHSAQALNRSLAPHPELPHLMLSGGADGLLVLWDMEAKKSVGTRRMHAAICSVAYSCSGHLLAVGLGSGEVFVQASVGGDLAAAQVALRPLLFRGGCLGLRSRVEGLGLGSRAEGEG